MASPSDLPAERKALRDIIAAVNRAMSQALRIQFELLGWEDTLPGAARPQALINDDVDRCSLFIGMLYKRWGTETGEYSSGFEEEFARASARNRTTSGNPEIWLLFKKLPRDEAVDAGPQLQRVLDFRKSVTAQRELLYKEFDDAEQLQALLTEYLMRFAFRQADAGVRDAAYAHVGDETSLTTALDIPPHVISGAATAELASALQFWAAQARNLSSTYSPPEQGRTSIARLALFQSALLAEYGMAPSISAPQAVMMYKMRRAISPTHPEMRMLLRSVLYGVRAPAWYWLRSFDAAELQRAFAAGTSSSAEVRLRANGARMILKLSQLTGEEIDDEALKTALAGVDDPGRLPAEVVGALERANINQLEKLHAQGSALGRRAGRSVAAEIMRRHVAGDLEVAIRLFIDDSSLPSAPLIAALERPGPAIDDDLVATLMASPLPEVRAVAAAALGRKAKADAPTTTTLLALLQDENALVKKRAVAALHRRQHVIDEAALRSAFRRVGELDPDEEDQITSTQLSLRHGAAVLDAMVDLFDHDGGLAAYMALLRLEGGVDRARSDLAENFETLVEESVARSRYATREDAEDRGIIDLYRERFREAALSTLLPDAESADAALALRIVADSHPYSKATSLAFDILARVGGVDEMRNLVEDDRARTVRGETAISAIAARILGLPILTKTSGSFAASLVLAQPCDAISFAKSQLPSPDARVRAGALAILTELADDSALEAALDEHLLLEQPLIDVILRLDEELYLRRRLSASRYDPAE